MQDEKAGDDPSDRDRSQLWKMGALALLVGGVAGLVGAVFRLALLRADAWRQEAVVWAQGAGLLGLVLVVAGCGAATAIAAWLVGRFAPHASGSGIPDVEAVLRRDLVPPPWQLIPVKFVGGVLAIGAGLALGREGPSVQIGANLATLIGRLFRCSLPDCLILLAGGAGAGLATAFNAPIAGAVFVLEELARRFDTRITIATLGASAGAIAVARVFLGDAPDFQVAPLPFPGFATVPLHLLLGALAGLLGIAYNRTILWTLAVTGRLGWPVAVRGGLMGAVIGVVAWFLPDLVGGGDPLTQRALSGEAATSLLLWMFLCRFAIGPFSYAARTPGGLFAPLLVLGAQGGLLYGRMWGSWATDLGMDPRGFAVVGLAALFTAVVRSPLTGIVLAIELTENFTLLLPMLSACFAAMLVPTLLGQAPIYDALAAKALPTAAQIPPAAE